MRPALPGIDLPFVAGVQTVDDGEALLARARHGGCHNVVVVGGGYIGLEMAEAFVRWGANVTMLEAAPQVMGTLDADMAEPVASALRGVGVDLRTSIRVQGFEPGRVLLEDGHVDADLVVLGLGAAPSSALAEAAGIDLGAKGAIAVDRRQRTRTDGVWAAGDCAESRPPRVAGGRCTWPSARWPTSRAGWPASTSGAATPRSPAWSAPPSPRCASTEVARTGLGEREADEAGFGWVSARIETTVAAGYFPDAGPVTVKLVAERRHRAPARRPDRGWRGLGQADRHPRHGAHGGHDGRSTLVDLDLAYAPPFSQRVGPGASVAARKAAAEVSRRPLLATCGLSHRPGDTRGNRSETVCGEGGAPMDYRRHRVGADRHRHWCCS